MSWNGGCCCFSQKNKEVERNRRENRTLGYCLRHWSNEAWTRTGPARRAGLQQRWNGQRGRLDEMSQTKVIHSVVYARILQT